MSRIGLGILTYNRAEAFRVCAESVVEHLSDVVDDFFVYNDGSDPECGYKEVELPEHWKVESPSENRGVAAGKNWLLKQMIEAEDDFLFLCEDDLEILDERAITAYVEAHETTGIHHLNFALHGPLNKTGPETFWQSLPIYPHCVGAWSFYTRQSIELVGYMDENFHNCWEHVEHTNRIVRCGLTTPFWCFADVRDSGKYMAEQAVRTTLPLNVAYRERARAGWLYWKSKGTLPPGLRMQE